MCELRIKIRNPRMQLIERKWLKENLAKFRWESNPELCDDRTEHSTEMS